MIAHDTATAAPRSTDPRLRRTLDGKLTRRFTDLEKRTADYRRMG